MKYTSVSPLWLLRVTGNCFWFLDRPPVSKGLMCSPSLHLLLAFFSWCGGLLCFWRSFSTLTTYADSFLPSSFLAIRSIRVDCWILKLFLPDRSSKYQQTDTWKSAKKLSDFLKSFYVQSRVLVNCGLWEAGFGFLRGATWFRWSRARRFDQRRTIVYFGDPSGQKHVGGRRRGTHTADKVRTHGQTLLFYRYRFLQKYSIM